jgi:hypothetical protein
MVATAHETLTSEIKMPRNPKQLPLPPEAENDPAATEMVRAWIAAHGLHCVLNVGMWHKDRRHDERNAWGLIPADIARHVANALEEVTGLDRRESVRVIAEAFNVEIHRPTSGHRGQWPGSDDPVADFWNEP